MTYWQKITVVSILLFATAAGTRFAAVTAADAGREEQVRANVRKACEVATAAQRYAADHGGRFPDAARWEAQVRPYLPAGFTFALAGSSPRRLAMNPVFSRRDTAKLTDEQYAYAALFFESTATAPNAADKLASLPTAGDRVVVGYVPGHAYDHPLEWTAALRDPFWRKRLVGE